MKGIWRQLLKVGQQEVETTVAALPEPLRQKASLLQVTYEAVPDDSLMAGEYDPELLGLFVGPPLATQEAPAIPAQIFLFLENLWEFAGEDEKFYREEVRATYLHELGHYLGLDEIEIVKRGLE